MIIQKALPILAGIGLILAPSSAILVAQDTELDEDVYMADDDFDDLDTTVAEIETLIGLPPVGQLVEREADEDPADPRNLFGTEAQIRALLGEQPRFVYIPASTDPMIIPWVRDQIVVAERTTDARGLFDEARADPTRRRGSAVRALNIVRDIQERYPEAARVPEVASLRTSIEQWLAATPDGPVEEQVTEPVVAEREDIQLPQWVEANTRGIIVDRDHAEDSIVLVGDFILRPGDRVDRFPSVMVKSISAQQVVYEYQEQEFTIAVNPY